MTTQSSCSEPIRYKSRYKIITKWLSHFYRMITKNILYKIAFEATKWVTLVVAIVTLIFWLISSGDRERNRHYTAWNLINSSKSGGGEGGMQDALVDLNKSGQSLAGAPLSKAYLFKINLTGASLDRVNFINADLFLSNLAGADMWGAYMQKTMLRFANLNGVRLEKANLQGACLEGTSMNAFSIGCLEQINPRNYHVKHVKEIRYGKDCSQNFSFHIPTNMRNAKLRWAKLRGADLTEADLTGADLRNADLRKFPLDDKNWLKNNFIGLENGGEEKFYSYLHGMNKNLDNMLKYRGFPKTILKNTTLIGADLTDADLTDADLTDADLTDATLTGANLTGANISEKQIEQARCLCRTTLSNGQQDNRHCNLHYCDNLTAEQEKSDCGPPLMSDSVSK